MISRNAYNCSYKREPPQQFVKLSISQQVFIEHWFYDQNKTEHTTNHNKAFPIIGGHSVGGEKLKNNITL